MEAYLRNKTRNYEITYFDRLLITRKMDKKIENTFFTTDFLVTESAASSLTYEDFNKRLLHESFIQ